MQFLLPASQKDFTLDIVKASLEADIQLCKLQHASIKKLIHSISGQHCPSKPVCQGHVNELAMQELERAKEMLMEKMFVVVDEAEVRSKKYVNIWLEFWRSPVKPMFLLASR